MLGREVSMDIMRPKDGADLESVVALSVRAVNTMNAHGYRTCGEVRSASDELLLQIGIPRRIVAELRAVLDGQENPRVKPAPVVRSVWPLRLDGIIALIRAHDADALLEVLEADPAVFGIEYREVILDLVASARARAETLPERGTPDYRAGTRTGLVDLLAQAIGVEVLTPTQQRIREVYRIARTLRAKGKTYVEIGEELGLSAERARVLLRDGPR
jgi:hypothetical protein